MKKTILVCLALAMLLCFAGCSSGVPRAEYDKMKSDYDEVVARNEELAASLTEMLDVAQKDAAKKMDEFETRDITFSAIAKSIEETSSCTIVSDDIILITIPVGANDIETVRSNIGKYGMMIPSAVKTSTFKSCILMVVDSDNLCYFGYTFKSEGDPSIFVSDNFSSQNN